MTKYHFIGIKGSGMSSLAQILDDMGYNVQGSDVETSFFTQKPLEERGIPMLPFDAKNIEEGMCVIASNAFGENHSEVKAAHKHEVPLYRYHQFLGEFAQGFINIAVTGSHGKTSTTGLLAHVLRGIEPTSYLIGDGTGRGEKESRYFAFEACEYRRHFLAYHPDYAIITNIDFDHPDYYTGMDDVLDAFSSFSKQVNKKIIACGDCQQIRKLKPLVPVMYYGLDDANDVQARNIVTVDDGMEFDLYVRGEWVDIMTIPLFGNHNISNALAVIGLCLAEGLPLDLVKQHLKSFQGVKRRFSEKIKGNQILIDDYAHHPTEVKATIESTRIKYPHKKLISIFQPHTYTRTETFLDEFAAVLSAADQVYLCDIFGSAREKKGTLSIQDLLDKIPSSKLISEETVAQLSDDEDAVLLFMGAGDIQKIQQAYEQLSLHKN